MSELHKQLDLEEERWKKERTDRLAGSMHCSELTSQSRLWIVSKDMDIDEDDGDETETRIHEEPLVSSKMEKGKLEEWKSHDFQKLYELRKQQRLSEFHGSV